MTTYCQLNPWWQTSVNSYTKTFVEKKKKKKRLLKFDICEWSIFCSSLNMFLLLPATGNCTSDSDCLNGGTCPSLNVAPCTCVDDFTGSFCQVFPGKCWKMCLSNVLYHVYFHWCVLVSGCVANNPSCLLGHAHKRHGIRFFFKGYIAWWSFLGLNTAIHLLASHFLMGCNGLTYGCKTST